MEKRCSSCKETKPRDCFHKARSKWDGLHDRCKGCRKQEHLDAREANVARAMKWNAENRERRTAIVEKSYNKHRPVRLQHAREFAANKWATNPEHREQRRQYVYNRPDVRWRVSMNSMGKEWGVFDYSATWEDWQAILAAYAHKCHYCGAEGKMHTEHKIPFARGGQHTKDNIVPSCNRCNVQKNQLTDAEYFDVLARRAAAKARNAEADVAA